MKSGIKKKQDKRAITDREKYLMREAWIAGLSEMHLDVESWLAAGGGLVEDGLSMNADYYTQNNKANDRQEAFFDKSREFKRKKEYPHKIKSID